MSLLMDALRRAENERRQQAARESRSESAQTMSPQPDGDALVMRNAPTLDGDDSATFDATKISQLADFSLELAAAAPSELTLEPLEQKSSGPANGEPAISAPAGEATGTTTLGARLGRTEQTATLPSTRALHSDMTSYFDQSQSAEIPRTAGAADMTLEDVAAHTLVGARTVFAASERPRSGRVVAGAVGFAIVLVMVIGLAVLFYARQSAPPVFVPSPTVASGVEKPLVRELPIVPLEPRPERPDDELARIDTRSAVPPAAAASTGAETAGTLAAPVASAAAALPPAATPAALRPLAEAAPVPAPSPAPPAAPTPAASSPAPTTAAAPTLASTPQADVGAGEVRIARRRAPLTVDSDIARAYAAFQRGDLKQAQTLYNAALARHPDARDALLGLGAIALKRGDLAQAYRHYANVLERNPDDAVASAALFSLAAGNGEETAARLRLLLDRHADLAVLHFALGNWYARQGRWGDAQQAYFDAVRLDGVNADYVYNLAVSLDRLGQGRAALDYYQKSIGLADATGASFNPADALARIGSLSAAPAPAP